MALNKNAKKWVRALRSGKYKQAKMQLADGGKYCCLGVACELAVKDGVINEYDGNNGELPDEVMNWLGLQDSSGKMEVKYKGKDDILHSDLAGLNDRGNLSFKQISRIIESEPDGLFV